MVFLSGSKPLGLAQAANPQEGAANTVAAPHPATLGVTRRLARGHAPQCTRITWRALPTTLRPQLSRARSSQRAQQAHRYAVQFQPKTATTRASHFSTQCICLRPKRQRSSQQRLIRNAAQQLRPPRVGQQIGASHHENSKANSQRNAKANRRPRTERSGVRAIRAVIKPINSNRYAKQDR